MRRKGWHLGLGVALLAWSGGMLLTETSSGSMPMQKKAKELGFPVENCMYCHNEKLPKEGAVTYNDRGKWLQSEKDKRKAAEVDVAWLKEYPGDKK
jgi:hypothetical protein